MTPMAALVFTATFALIIWIPTFALTARVYPPNEGKDLPNQGKISPRVIFCCCLGYDMGRYRVAQCMTAICFCLVFLFWDFIPPAKRNYNIFLRKSLWGSPSVCGYQIRRSNGRLRRFFHQTKFKLGLYWEWTLWFNRFLIILEPIFFPAHIFIYSFIFH